MTEQHVRGSWRLARFVVCQRRKVVHVGGAAARRDASSARRARSTAEFDKEEEQRVSQTGQGGEQGHTSGESLSVPMPVSIPMPM